MKTLIHKFMQLIQGWQRGKISCNQAGPAISSGESGDTTKVFRRHRRAERYWILEVIAGNDRGRSYPVYAPELRIGRQAENHIQLQDPKVSRFHALVQQQGSHLLLSDAQSTNGTRVNSQLITVKHQLAPGDQISLGETILQVRLESTTDRK